MEADPGRHWVSAAGIAWGEALPSRGSPASTACKRHSYPPHGRRSRDWCLLCDGVRPLADCLAAPRLSGPSGFRHVGAAPGPEAPADDSTPSQPATGNRLQLGGPRARSEVRTGRYRKPRPGAEFEVRRAGLPRNETASTNLPPGQKLSRGEKNFPITDRAHTHTLSLEAPISKKRRDGRGAEARATSSRGFVGRVGRASLPAGSERARSSGFAFPPRGAAIPRRFLLAPRYRESLSPPPRSEEARACFGPRT